MKINRLFLASIIIMTFIMVAGVTSAQNVAGVSTGDQFTYDFSVYFKSTNPDIVIPQAWIEDNKTQWLKINVINVTDPIVAYSITQHLENGTEQLVDTSSRRFKQQFQRRVIERNSKFEKMTARMGIDKVYIPAGGDYSVPLIRFFEMRARRIRR